MMGKYYAQWRRPKQKERPWKVHPIWRGIGCIMMVIIPIVSFVIAEALVEMNLTEGWVAVPPDLVGPASSPYLYAKLAMTVLVAVILFAMYTLGYMVIYSVLGPPRYSRIDAPPERRKPASRRKGTRGDWRR
jgi:hypothetical protein